MLKIEPVTSPPSRRVVTDALLVLAVWLLDLALGWRDFHTLFDGHRLEIAWYAAIGAGILLLRRRAPMAVLVGCVAHSVLAHWLTPSYTPLFPTWVALYAVAALVRPSRSWIGFGATTPVVISNAISQASDRPGESAGRVIFVSMTAGLVVLVLIYGLGRWVRWSAERRRIEAAQAAADAAAAERTRIAREMHDVVAHGVTLMLLQAGGARRLLRTRPERAEQALDQVDALGQQAIIELRRMLALLQAEDDGTPPASPVRLDMLPDLVAGVRTDRTPVALEVVGTPRPLAPGVDVAVYRTAQEALTNATRYGTPGEPVDVRVTWAPETVQLRVVNRVPATRRSRRLSGGRGLVGLRERARAVGGTVESGPGPDGTFVVEATYPAGADVLDLTAMEVAG